MVSGEKQDLYEMSESGYSTASARRFSYFSGSFANPSPITYLDFTKGLNPVTVMPDGSVLVQSVQVLQALLSSALHEMLDQEHEREQQKQMPTASEQREMAVFISSVANTGRLNITSVSSLQNALKTDAHHLKVLVKIVSELKKHLGEDFNIELTVDEDYYSESAPITLFIRQKEYNPDISGIIDAVVDAFYEELDKFNVFPIVTTDFRHPDHLRGNAPQAA